MVSRADKELSQTENNKYEHIVERWIRFLCTNSSIQTRFTVRFKYMQMYFTFLFLGVSFFSPRIIGYSPTIPDVLLKSLMRDVKYF